MSSPAIAVSAIARRRLCVVVYLNSLDSLARLGSLVEFYVEEHNTRMPHAAFDGQTPDEMYFGTAANLPAELAAAREQARAARLASNRAMSCDRCLGRQASLPVIHIPP
jgi:putative transposase